MQLRKSAQYAVFEGREYQALTLHNGLVSLLNYYTERDVGTTDRAPAYRSRLVAPDTLQSLESIDVYCRWNGHNFFVLEVRQETAILQYLDNDRRWAGLAGLEEVEFGVWEIEVPLRELADPREERTDQISRVLEKYERAGRPDPETVDSV